MRRTDDHRWAIVLAAGEGTRLREFVRERTGTDLPKQYSAIVGTRSLLRHTLDRIERIIRPRHAVTVVAAEHASLWKHILSTEERRRSLSIPRNRETAPNVLLAALTILADDPEARAVIVPSDQFVLEEDHFLSYVESAFKFSEAFSHHVVLLGVRPQQPDPDYGWIDVTSDFLRHDGNRFYKVVGFHEKPSSRAASDLFQRGALLNSMVTVASLRSVLGLFRHSAPGLYDHFRALKTDFRFGSPPEDLEKVFDTAPSLSFCKAIIQMNPDRLRVLRLEGIHWSDWGKKERVMEDLRSFGVEP